MFKNRISAVQKEEGKEKHPKKRPDLGEGGKSDVRTFFHGRHVPDLPGGEISIESTSNVKHCITQQQRTVQG